MTHLEAGAPAADVREISVANLLAEFDRAHAEALALLDTLVRRWGHLWASRSDAETAEFPVVGHPLVRGAHADAA